MYLFIDSSQKDEMQVAVLEKDGSVLVLKKVKSKYQQAEKLLPSIETVLDSIKMKKENIKGVLVVHGPGGFTSLRIGIATANAFGFSLNIPVVGIEKVEIEKNKKYFEMIKKIKRFKKFRESVLPEYGSEPNIG
jgi:tRNA threonylcarbamoyladenosine biosynthesis protein TsaB